MALLRHLHLALQAELLESLKRWSFLWKVKEKTRVLFPEAYWTPKICTRDKASGEAVSAYTQDFSKNRNDNALTKAWSNYKGYMVTTKPISFNKIGQLKCGFMCQQKRCD